MPGLKREFLIVAIKKCVKPLNFGEVNNKIYGLDNVIILSSSFNGAPNGEPFDATMHG